MLNRRKFLRVHGVDADAWAKRYGLEPFTAPCFVCGADLTTTLPFADGELRGLIAPYCSCGDKRPPYTVFAPAGCGRLFTGLVK